MKLSSWFVRPATRAFFQESKKTRNFSFGKAVHGYIYARWIYLYIGIGTGEHPIAKIIFPLIGFFNRFRKSSEQDEKITFADTYHGKVVSTDGARQLIGVNKPIRILDLEQVIPYARATDIILCNPDHIVVLECPCRSVRPNPCLPLDVCLIIGEPMAALVLEHHPGKSRSINQHDALDILEAEHKRGHVHHVFFKEAALNRFYAICNCCSCCCGAIQAMKNGIPMLASSGFVTKIDDSCIHCGQCTSFCQFGALYKDGKQIYLDESKCLGCGVCVDVCPQDALALIAVPARGIPLEINKLIQEMEN